MRQAAGDGPQTSLRRPFGQVVELAACVDALDHFLAERAADRLSLRTVAGRQNKEIGGNCRSIPQLRTIDAEVLDPVILQ